MRVPRNEFGSAAGLGNMANDNPQLKEQALQQILDVTRKLAAPYDLDTMLSEVVDAARSILHAERGTVFLYDTEADELVVRVGTELDSIRMPAYKGIVGESAQTRKLINVPDCYADERFNRDIDTPSNGFIVEGGEWKFQGLRVIRDPGVTRDLGLSCSIVAVTRNTGITNRIELQTEFTTNRMG